MSENLKPAGGEYVVVARRYRPTSFGELVGQSQVSQALANAINTNRVGHAYLFTGARGVGKTSTARIFAKALNCQNGPTPDPCNECEVCLSVAVGEDVDVLEIDGASNRGIEEIRQLRSNVNIRPSRSRFKIYIIDEVHMLTTPAFNALLKTLEEPPEHVKFMFCTTDPEKIPITVLSRCQRFDLPPVQTGEIFQRLREIATSEGVEAEDKALRALARQAHGSMRDSQSLLEQLLSFCGDRLKLEDVHSLLGTAGQQRLIDIATHLATADAAGALGALDQAVADGVDPGRLAEQLVGFYRDVLTVTVGCSADLLLSCGEDEMPALQQLATKIGPQAVLASLQILDQTTVRIRHSSQPRVLLEMAIVRLALLGQLDDLAALIENLADTNNPVTISRQAGDAKPTHRSGGDPSVAPEPKKPVTREKKNESISVELPEAGEAAVSAPPAPTVNKPCDLSNPRDMWEQTIAALGDMTADFARCYQSVAISAPNRVVVCFAAAYTLQKESCERADRKRRIEETLSQLAGKEMFVDLQLLTNESGGNVKVPPPISRRQRMRDTEKHPYVQKAMEIFGAELIRLDPPKNRK